MAKFASFARQFLKNTKIKNLQKKKPLYLFFVLLFIVILVSGSLYLLIFHQNSSPESTSVNTRGNAEQKDQSKGSTSNTASKPKKSSSSKNSATSSKSNQSTTAPSSSSSPQSPAPESLTATVAFYGDSQSDTDGEDSNHQNVVNYILGTSSSTVFHAGDLLEDGTQESLNRFNNVTSVLRSSRAFYSAQGNNERNSSVYFNNFNYPGNEHWYSVNVGNLHMVILDNYASSTAIGSEQYNWLAADLQSAASQSRSTGVIFHYPVYGAGGDYKGLIGTLVPLFRNYGVDFVVSGHEHSYQKALVNGIYYFVTSGQPSLGYMTARIYSTNRVEISVYNSSNSRIDSINFNAR